MPQILKHQSRHQLILLTLTVLAALTRFVGVTSSPPGFYVDEAAISAQVLCVSQSGSNLQGVHLPLFTEVLGGGYLTPTYLYPAAGWVATFGGSIESFRIFAAVCSLIFLIGVFVFSRRYWSSSEAAWLATLAAAISPWAFQFARIAWDPAIALAYLAWAFATLWGKSRQELAASGVLFALAAYSYPPLRVQIALMLPVAIGLLVWRHKVWKPYLITLTATLLTSLPLLKLTLSGEIQGRFAALSIFNPDYLQSTYGNANLTTGLKGLISNFELLLSPRYLLMNGDSNLRHSTGAFGIWSWLDALAILSALVLIACAMRRHRSFKSDSILLVAFPILGYLAGLLPAAMTWESNPHALRSIGSIIFLAIGTGGTLSRLYEVDKSFKLVIPIIAMLFSLFFYREYFGSYKERAGIWFDADIAKTASLLFQANRASDLTDVLQKQGIEYPPMAIRYYEIFYGVSECSSDPL